MTLSITTFSLITLSITTFSLMTLSITTFSIMTQFATEQNNYCHYGDEYRVLFIIMRNVLCWMSWRPLLCRVDPFIIFLFHLIFKSKFFDIRCSNSFTKNIFLFLILHFISIVFLPYLSHSLPRFIFLSSSYFLFLCPFFCLFVFEVIFSVFLSFYLINFYLLFNFSLFISSYFLVCFLSLSFFALHLPVCLCVCLHLFLSLSLSLSLSFSLCLSSFPSLCFCYIFLLPPFCLSLFFLSLCSYLFLILCFFLLVP